MTDKEKQEREAGHRPMPLAEAIKALEDLPPIGGTWWGDAILTCRNAAKTLVKEGS